MATIAATRVSPAVFGDARTEAALVQPVIMGTWRRDRWALTGTLNGEGITLRRGWLNPGSYGEGYIDRRHPHTLVHELMGSVRAAPAGPLAFSLAAGKGFVPFGTDDPMMRPFTTYPVNHHHAQIIERVQVIGGLRLSRGERAMVFEQAWFNGDEPVGPFTGPQWDRVGDSRSARLTLIPRASVELQASHAFVRSPGIVQGGAFDHRQSDVAIRYDRGAEEAHGAHDAHRYLMAEWARTDEGIGGVRAFRYESLLAEGLMSRGRWSGALRFERTDRPESSRLLDPFRTPTGHIDFQIVGITRWTVVTGQVAAPAVAMPMLPRHRLTPFVEVAASQAEAQRRPTVFEPRTFFGASTLWSVTAGLRLHVGHMRARMGRYGVLAPPAPTVGPSSHTPHP